MTQLTFQNIRNLGANGNQPLITNQNDFQIFDNVTWIKGKHTREERRQHHLPVARDPQRRHDRRHLQLQQQHDVELRRPAAPAARSTAPPGFDVASFMLGLVNTKNRNLFDAEHLHREAAGVLALRAGRLPRHQPPDDEPRAALGRVPAVDREGQSAVELRRVDRQVRRGLRRRGGQRRGSWPLPADLLEGATSGRASASPTI